MLNILKTNSFYKNSISLLSNMIKNHNEKIAKIEKIKINKT